MELGERRIFFFCLF